MIKNSLKMNFLEHKEHRNYNHKEQYKRHFLEHREHRNYNNKEQYKNKLPGT